MIAPLRLIPDINVLLSGLTSPHGPARDLYLAAQRFDVRFLLAEDHLEELLRVLSYPAVLQLGGGITPADAFELAVELHRMTSSGCARLQNIPQTALHVLPCRTTRISCRSLRSG